MQGYALHTWSIFVERNTLHSTGHYFGIIKEKFALVVKSIHVQLAGGSKAVKTVYALARHNWHDPNIRGLQLRAGH